MIQEFKDWLAKLKPHERNALMVLAVFLAAVLLFALGTQFGGVIYQILN